MTQQAPTMATESAQQPAEPKKRNTEPPTPEEAKALILKTCKIVMKSRKARYSERIAAAHLMAGVLSLYGIKTVKHSVSRASASKRPSKLNEILEQAAA